MIGSRLKEERERLGLTQEAFAAASSAGRRTLIDWEKGVSSPTAVQLAALSSVGVDVLYVVTGARSSSPSIAPDEAALLDNYRHSAPEARNALKATSAALAKCDRPGESAKSA